jgi:hypothetical protein
VVASRACAGPAVDRHYVMPSTLDYASGGLHTKSLAVPAFICGLLSGPAAFGLALLGLALLGAANHLDEGTKELLGL